jgi:predicted transporter
MEEAFKKAEELASHLKEYLNSKIDSVKLDAAEKSSKLLSNFTATIVVALIAFLSVSFISMSVAFGIAKLTGELFLGFLSVGLFYLLCGILLWVYREKFIRMPMMNSILQHLFKDENHEEN